MEGRIDRRGRGVSGAVEIDRPWILGKSPAAMVSREEISWIGGNGKRLLDGCAQKCAQHGTIAQYQLKGGGSCQNEESMA